MDTINYEPDELNSDSPISLFLFSLVPPAAAVEMQILIENN